MVKRAHAQAFSQVQQAHQQSSQVYLQKLDEVKASYERTIAEQKQELSKLRANLSQVQQAHQQLSQAYQQKLDKVKASYERIITEQMQAYQPQKEELSKLTVNQRYHRLQIDELLKQNRELQQVNGRLERVEAVQAQSSCRLDGLMEQQKAELATQGQAIVAFLQEHTTPPTLTPFYFVVVNLDHYQRNNYMFNSEPFYSHPGGYKMIMTIYPNGVGETKNTHVSVYVGIIRGEFDDKLRWPFSGSVTVEAYNRTLRQWSNKKEIVLNPHECDLRVVSQKTNVLVDGKKGYQDFLLLDDFKNDYVKSTNVARFRVLHVKVYS